MTRLEVPSQGYRAIKLAERIGRTPTILGPVPVAVVLYDRKTRAALAAKYGPVLAGR